MAYSQATLIKRIRYELRDNPWYDALTNSPSTTGTTFTVADGTKYSVGVILECQDDGELVLVTGVSGNNLTVIRNYMFSVTATAGTGTAHTTPTICANPKFYYTEIVEAIALTLNDLWPYVYRLNSVSVTPVAGTHFYDLGTTPPRDLSSIQQVNVAGTKVEEYGKTATYAVKLLVNAPTSLITNGTGIWLRALRNTTNTIYVRGISPVDDTVGTGSYTYLNGDVEASCVIFYAAAKLVGTSEIVRLTQEDVSMGDATVQPGMRRNLSQYLEAKGLQYRRQWEAKLRATLPVLPLSRGREA